MLKFKSPSSIVISGPSQSGKTSLTFEMLKHADGMFEKPPAKIMYAYKAWQPIYEEMEQTVRNIEFLEGLPTKEDLKILSEQGDHTILILDDLLMEATQSLEILSLFTTFVHHYRISTILILQNLFTNAKYMRCISLNTQYFLLFKTSRDKQQISTFARQVFANKSKYMISAYEKAVSIPYNYLLVDLYPSALECYQLRSRVLPGQNTIVYASKS